MDGILIHILNIEQYSVYLMCSRMQGLAACMCVYDKSLKDLSLFSPKSLIYSWYLYPKAHKMSIDFRIGDKDMLE